jgi:glycosyltransferase involved in cell wall biosynthesis
MKRVGFWGFVEAGPCHEYRGGMHAPLFPFFDWEPVFLRDFNVVVNPQTGEAQIDLSVLDTLDVLLFRRYYNTSWKCSSPSCANLRWHFDDISGANEHARLGPNHVVAPQDMITRPVWEVVEKAWKKGIVYETDDLHISHGVKSWNGYKVDVDHERDLVARMARRAHVVTVSTPALSEFYSAYNKNVVVIRNSLNPELYKSKLSRSECKHDHSKVRIVYYGSAARMRDYLGSYFTGKKEDGTPHCYLAIEELRQKGKVTSVFIGADDDNLMPLFKKVFDEVYERVDHTEFPRLLADVHADIGVAPLGGDEFDRCKSELHWMEISATGAAFVGQDFAHRYHPYSVVKHGKDGLLARSGYQWRYAINALVNDANLRQEIGERARARIEREYNYRDRAKEWVEAFKKALLLSSSGRSIAAPAIVTAR